MKKLKSINAQILTIVLSVLLVMSGITIYVVRTNLKETLYSRVHEQVSDNAMNGMHIIDKMYDGEWKLVGEKLYKGTTLINGTTEIVDSIQKSISIPVTIFAHDTRIATNIIENGNRIVGTKAPEIVIEEVLNKGKVYIGSVQVLGKDYEGIYIPIKDANEKVIGMFFAGEETESITKDLSHRTTSVTIIILVILILSIILSTILTRRIVKKIITVVEGMVLIGGGDFTVRTKIKSGDEIQLLADTQNKMAEDLGSLISKIKKISSDLAASSDTLAATSEETTATTEEISRALNNISETTTSQAHETNNGLIKTKELSSNIQKISGSIDNIISMFKNAAVVNNRGIKIVELLSDKTEQSNSATSKVNTAILEMDDKSQKINVIMNTITQIANQTNLLSLNASIEAARAGEAGLGFSVVASEIRKLAEQSSAAAKEIRDIINEIQIQSKKAVSEMNTTKIVITEQDKAVDETKEIFREFLSTISNLKDEAFKISEMNKEMILEKDNIVGVMQEISASAEQNSAATQQISASSQEQVAGMEEVSKTAEQLNDIAQKLNSEIEKFKI